VRGQKVANRRTLGYYASTFRRRKDTHSERETNQKNERRELRKLTISALPLLFFLSSSFTGQTGLGKSTLINTLFASHLIDTKGRFEPDELVRQTTDIQAVSHSKFPQSLTFVE